MIIEHESKDIKILRYGTLALALTSVYGGKHYEDRRHDIVQGLMTSEFWAHNPNYEMLHAPLAWAYECELEYTRSFALISFERECGIGEFCCELLSKNYVPAGTNETVAFLRELKKRRIAFGSILHLGTRFLDEQFREQLLVTREDGRPDFHLSCGMKLKPCYQIVIAKIEKKTYAK